MDLFPYQVEGAEWLAGRKYALLADDPGLGKTTQLIRAMDLVCAENALCIVPAVGRVNWGREIEEGSIFSPKVNLVFKPKDFKKDNGIITVVSYDLVCRIPELIRPWDILIADESHFVKSKTAKRTKALVKIAQISNRVWFATATPSPRGDPGEMYVMLKLFGKYTKDYWSYVREFCAGYDGNHGFVITGIRPQAKDRLKGMLDSILLRRTKEEVMGQLPPITFGEITVEAGEVDEEICFTKQWVDGKNTPNLLRKEVEEQFTLMQSLMKTVGEGRDWMTALGAMEASTSTLRKYVGLQKVDGVADMVKLKLESGTDKIILFAIHRDVIETLRVKLKAYSPVTLYGGTPCNKRQLNIDKFQSNDKCRVFIGNIKAAGVLITLTASSHVIIVEPSGVPGDNAQAVMRAHRIGQTRPVTVEFVTLDGNELDKKIQRTIKRRTQDLVSLGLGISI